MNEISSKSLPVSSGLIPIPYCMGYQMQHYSRYRTSRIIGAKLVLGRSKYDSNKEALAELHWLPVKSRIKFKILVLVFKCLRGEAPEYLMNLLVRCTELTHNLRSSNIKDGLVIPRTVRQTFASRSFSVAAPTLWNRLPNLPYISKLVGKAVLEQINLNFNAHSLLPDYQSA